jgi:hypothetical protein
MIGMLDRALRAHSKTSVTFQWEELLGMVLDKLLRLFQTNKASPFAVDSMNRSLLHYLAGLVSLVFTHARKVNSKTHLDSIPLIAAAELRAVFALAKRGSANPLLEALTCLVKCKVPATDYDMKGA